MGTEIDEIKAVVTLASYMGTLDKRILCPLPEHRDEHPSCDIDHRKNLWHCKVCDVGGDIFKLVMLQDNCDFGDALKKLADKAGVKLGPKTPEAQKAWEQRQRIYKARAYAVDYYHRYLLDHNGGMSYWKNRGITLETIKKMKLGWSDGNLTKSVKSTKMADLSLDDFVQAGLLKEYKDRPGSHYDWFDIRAIMPLYSNGRVMNISGRVTDYSRSEEKYRHLAGVGSKNFYNEDAISPTVWLFEGHPDTLTGIEMGLPAVGIVGTSGMQSPEKLAHCEEIWICPDNDKPGRAAAEKWAIEILRCNPQVKIHFVTLPDGIKDFNDWFLIYKDGRADLQAAFDRLAGSTKTLIEYKVDQLTDPDSLNSIWPMVAPLDSVSRERCFKRIKEKLTGVSLAAVRESYGEWKKAQSGGQDSGRLQVAGVSFEDDIPLHLNINFDCEQRRAHVCLFGQVRRVDEQGAEIVSREPILICSTIDADGNYKSEKILLDDKPGWLTSGSIPMKSVVKDRWMPSGVEKFLSGAARPMATGQLADEIAGFIKKYIWYENPANYDLLAFYAMGTYAARLFGSFPYLAINGLKRTGKSNTLEILEALCFNAQQSVNSSIAATFRIIESSFITWIRDEAEQFNVRTPENQDELTILNSGYKEGSSVTRVEKAANGTMEVREFQVFSPKIFGGINILNGTLLDRSILVKSYRAPKEVVAGMPKMNQQKKQWKLQATKLRSESYTWTLTKFPRLKEIFEDFPASNEIINREWEIWLPILAMAYMADEEVGNIESGNAEGYYHRMARFATEKSREKQEADREDAWECIILESILALQDNNEIHSIMSHPGWYPVGKLAGLLTDLLKKTGVYKDSSRLTPRKLLQILDYSQTVKDRSKSIKQIWHDGRNQKCVNLPRDAVEAALTRL